MHNISRVSLPKPRDDTRSVKQVVTRQTRDSTPLFQLLLTRDTRDLRERATTALHATYHTHGAIHVCCISTNHNRFKSRDSVLARWAVCATAAAAAATASAASAATATTATATATTAATDLTDHQLQRTRRQAPQTPALIGAAPRTCGPKASVVPHLRSHTLTPHATPCTRRATHRGQRTSAAVGGAARIMPQPPQYTAVSPVFTHIHNVMYNFHFVRRTPSNTSRTHSCEETWVHYDVAQVSILHELLLRAPATTCVKTAVTG